MTLDEALRLAGAGPDVQALTRALEVRASRDREITDVTGWTQIWVQPGMRVLDARDAGYAAQYFVTHSWALTDLAGAQRSAAARERDVLAARAQGAALARRLDAASAWAALRTAEREHDRIVEIIDAARASAETISVAVRAGVLTLADRAEADAFVADLELTRLDIEERMAEARIGLAAATGRGEAPALVTSGAAPVFELPAPEALRARLVQVDGLPEVHVRALAALAMAAHAEEQHAQYAPQLALGVQVQNEAPSGLSAFGIASLTFGAADLGARTHAALLGEVALESAGVEAARVEAMRAVELVLHSVEHERERTTAIRDRLVRALETLVALRERALGAGEGTTLELFDARHRLAEAQLLSTRAEGALMGAELAASLLLTALPAAPEGGARSM